jgi:hypothetical protein
VYIIAQVIIPQVSWKLAAVIKNDGRVDTDEQAEDYIDPDRPEFFPGRVGEHDDQRYEQGPYLRPVPYILNHDIHLPRTY